VTTRDDALTEAEVADRADTTVEAVRQLKELGLVADDGGTFRSRDVLRVRVLGELIRAGIDVEDLAAARAAGELYHG
jgi:hypothetical protein